MGGHVITALKRSIAAKILPKNKQSHSRNAIARWLSLWVCASEFCVRVSIKVYGGFALCYWYNCDMSMVPLEFVYEEVSVLLNFGKHHKNCTELSKQNY